MYCTKCGSKVSKNQNFCTKCGNKLIAEDVIVTIEQTASASSSVEKPQNIEELDKVIDSNKIEDDIKNDDSIGEIEVKAVEVEVVDSKDDFESLEVENNTTEAERTDKAQYNESNDSNEATQKVTETIEEKSLKLYCTKCGNKVKENAKFCTKCGESIQSAGKARKEKSKTKKEKSKKEKAIKANKAEMKVKKEKKQKKPKSVFKKVIISLVVLIFIVVGICVTAVLYTHYSEFEMTYKTIDYENYIKDNIKDMIKEKSNDTYDIILSSDLINSVLNSNLDMINSSHNDILIKKAYFDVEYQRLYFTIAYKNFDLNLSSRADIKMDEKSVEVNLDDFEAGEMNIPIPKFITNLLLSDMLKFSYNVEQIPDFIIANEIKYDKDSMMINYFIDYESLVKDFEEYKIIDNIDENIVKMYQYSLDSDKKTLSYILDSNRPLTQGDVKTIIELFEKDTNVLNDIFIALRKDVVDKILEDYKNYINYSVDSSSLGNIRKNTIRENFFDWTSKGTAPGVGITVGDSLDDMFNEYGYDYYYDDWLNYNYYYYEFINDPNMDSGGVIFLTPYSYSSNDYYTVTLIELYDPYIYLGFKLSSTIPQIKEILGEPRNQFYDSDTGYYKTVYKAGGYLVSFYSDSLDSECHYFDIREY